jgi:hypothetical protein
MSFTQKVQQLDETRNLNTSPWTVSGLKGDQFDYSFIMFCDSSGGGDNDVYVRANGDSGANYEERQMWGSGTAKGMGYTTTRTGFQFGNFTKNASSRNSLGIGLITGDSSQDRICKQLMCQGQPAVSQAFNVWNNNVDELTSLEFYGVANASYKWHIVVFETPKVGNGDNWELIKTLSWSSASDEKSVTGLKGDIDIQYLIDWESTSGEIVTEINNDSGANYILQQVQNTGSTFQADRATGLTSADLRVNSQSILNAETGSKRTIFSIAQTDNISAAKQYVQAYWYNNTATEITSLYFTPILTDTGKLKLFRRKNPKIPADIFRLPFEKIDEIDVDSADFTAGDSFPVKGDKVLMYRLEFTGETNAVVRMRTNADGGSSDYTYQNLIGDGTAEVANSGSFNRLDFLEDSNNTQQNSVLYLYPKSGEYRPMLNYSMSLEDRIRLSATWRNDSATEITSIDLASVTSGTVKGKFTLSAIYL